MTGRTFKEYSQEIVSQFLQTVMIIDDGLFYVTDKIPTKVTLLSPGEEDAVEAATGDESSEEDLASEASEFAPKAIRVEKPETEAAYDLDAKALVDAFAKHGIICATVKPSENEDLLDTVRNAIENVDFVVLDWRLNGQSGVDALKVIKHFCESDAASTHRVRLVAIYSGDPDLGSIGLKVSEALGNADKRDELVFDKGPLRVSVFGKDGATISNEQFKDRYLKIESLPNELIAEFTDKASGLVSNTVLRAVSAIRNNTHRLLTKLGRRIDPAFLAHRSLLPEPEDAGDHLLVLIAEELRSILEENGIAEFPGWDEIEAWMDEHYTAVNQVKPTGKGWANTNAIEKSVLLELLKNGIRKWENGPCSGGNRRDNRVLRKLELSQLFCRSDSEGRELDSEWGVLMSTKSHYGTKAPAPALTLGSILRRTDSAPDSQRSAVLEEKTQVENVSLKSAQAAMVAMSTPKGVPANEDYILCIQPRCDAVRLKEATQFVFLRLTPTKDDRKDEFTHVVRDHAGNGFIPLVLGSQVKDLVCLKFAPTEGGRVIAAAQDGKYIFLSDGVQYEWIGDLKYAPGQRDATSFAVSLSRLGLDESEWIRLSALGLRGMTELILLADSAEEQQPQP